MRHVRAWAAQVSDHSLLVWMLLALVNLASRTRGVAHDGTSATMRLGVGWLWRGTGPVRRRGVGTDYPPTAIVVLSPIALLNVHVSAWPWALLELLLLAGIGVRSFERWMPTQRGGERGSLSRPCCSAGAHRARCCSSLSSRSRVRSPPGVSRGLAGIRGAAQPSR